MKTMRKQLIKLLSIHGVSGDETNVRNYLKPILKHSMDTVLVDDYGNLLGEKKIGNGKGATVLLSAHMDTVRNVLKERELIEDNGIISSDKGALGADDRAGITVILTVLRNLESHTGFNGTLKIAFSREEEIGCVGSGKINPKWYSDVDLAIVVDRRGNRDIVVGNYSMPFCSNEVGRFLEDVSVLSGMDWQCVEGGISDAMTFAENGINSVNLSVGYRNEHTDKEYVVLDDMADTVRLIMQAFAVINTFYDTFGEVPETENEWIQGYDYKKYSKHFGYSDWQDRQFLYGETFDMHGDVFVYEVGVNDVAISQGDKEIVMSRKNLKSLFDQLKNAL